MTGLCRLRDPCSLWEIEYDSLNECNASCRPRSSSSSRSRSSAPTTHTVCEGKICKRVSGPGTNQCDVNEDCSQVISAFFKTRRDQQKALKARLQTGNPDGDE